MPNYIWYPFTQMKSAAEPVHIQSGKGALLSDVNGNSYIDAISSWWTNMHGHAHPYIAQKLSEQAAILEHVIFAGFTHTPALQLAERLVTNYLPRNLTKIFFSDDGSTSVEVAIKMALQYWVNTGTSKKKIIAFEQGYHGDTFGSMSVSGRSAFTAAFRDQLFDVEFIPLPVGEIKQHCFEKFDTLCKSGNIAAFIYEPLVLGAGGMLMYDAAELELLLQIAKSNSVICIADEVMTGFYRTGKFFASEYCKTQPDIICLSKGLSGGTMALGVTACAQFIFDAFYDDDKLKALYHGHSFTANPLACTAANASLDLFEENSCTVNIQRIIEQHRNFINSLTNKSAVNIRQCGTILALDIKTQEGTNYFNSLRDTIYKYALDNGVLLRPLGNTIYLMPPYCITEAELQKVYRVMEAMINLAGK